MSTEIANYSYTFSDIGSRPSAVRVVSSSRTMAQHIQIAVNDDTFLYRRHSRMESQIADLVDIGVAVYLADRLSLCQQKYQRRSLHLHLPLRHPEFFQRADIVTMLQDTLHHFSHDEWEFSFSRRLRQGRMSELQTSMGEAPQLVEVALWSGGLDALAGLDNRIDMHSSSAYTLFGTGSNLMMQGVQKRTARQMRNAFPEHNIK